MATVPVGISFRDSHALISVAQVSARRKGAGTDPEIRGLASPPLQKGVTRIGVVRGGGARLLTCSSRVRLKSLEETSR